MPFSCSGKKRAKRSRHRGNEPTAAGGGGREASEWQRSADEEGACRRRRCWAPQQEGILTPASAPVNALPCVPVVVPEIPCSLFAHEISTTATRSARCIRRWRRSHRSPLPAAARRSNAQQSVLGCAILLRSIVMAAGGFLRRAHLHLAPP